MLEFAIHVKWNDLPTSTKIARAEVILSICSPMSEDRSWR